MKNRVCVAIAVAAGLCLAACGSESAPETDVTTLPIEDPASSASPSAMAAGGTIINNLTAAPNHRTLVAAVEQAGLVSALSASGPVTLFAPTDAAFAQIPPGTRDEWMRPDQKAVLAAILNYHVVPGRLTVADLQSRIAEAGGKAVLKTADGRDLTATTSGDGILLTSASGNKAMIAQGDIDQANGIVHVIDAVLRPS